MAEYVSSDTNVWIDFEAIGATELPFRLPCTYVMWRDAVDDEIRSPRGLRSRLLEAGLVAVRITTEEFYLADGYGERFGGLSVYDRVALAIAKQRGITLLTGDGRLRRAAGDEGVEVLGTIGVLDRLLESGAATPEEYGACIRNVKPSSGDVWDFIRRISEWVKDPCRKGMERSG